MTGPQDRHVHPRGSRPRQQAAEPGRAAAFHAALRHWCTQRHVSQVTLENACGVTPGYFRQLRRRDNLPDPGRVRLIADALNVPMLDLLIAEGLVRRSDITRWSAAHHDDPPPRRRDHHQRRTHPD